MTVKITLEFEGVDQAIVALGKLTGTPVAAKQPRKGRADKGQQREPYGPREKVAVAGAAASAAEPKVDTSKAGVTEPAKAEAVATLNSTPLGTTPATASGTVTTAEDAQNAFEKYFNSFSGQTAIDKGRALLAQFGAKRVAEVPAERRADFIAAAKV